jgi:signal transduction histidine kinase
VGVRVPGDDRIAPQPRRGGRIARAIERALTAAYERLGGWYLYAVIGVTFVQGWLLMAFTVAIGIPHFPDAMTTVRLAVTAAVVGYAGWLVMIVWRYRPTLVTVSRWWRNGRPATGAEGVWKAASTFAPQYPLTMLVATALCVPGVVWVAADLGLSGEATVATLIGTSFMVVLGGVWVYAFADVALRPLLLDAASRVPQQFRPDQPVVSYRTKVFGLFVGVGMSLSGVGVVIGSGDEPLEDVLAPTLVVVGVSVVITVALSLVLGRSLQAPIEDLIDLTARVGAGDRTAHAPVGTADELGELAASFNQMVHDLRRSDQAVRAAQARTVAAADEARRNVERDLHDGAQQHLVLAQLKLGMLDKAAAEGRDVLQLTAELRDELAGALRELRELARGIYPAVLESDGLASALAEAGERCTVPVVVDCDGMGRHPREVEAAVYFCCLEALQNAAKHAGPTARAEVRLEQHDGDLRFEVSDDGAGFDPDTPASVGGLQHMSDRLGALGGSVEVRSVLGGGTTVNGIVPLTDRMRATDVEGSQDLKLDRQDSEHILGRVVATPHRTLIVDDHAGFRSFASELCTAAGFEVVGEADDGSSALKAVDQLCPDIVLLDVQLPDLDGFAVADALAERADPPIVVLTSTRDAAELGSRLSEAPAAGFISKRELSAHRLSALVSEDVP